MKAIVGVGEYVLVVISLVLLLAPVVLYLLYGWPARRRHIVAVFYARHVFGRYLRVFFPAELDECGKPRGTFDEHYDHRFRRTQYFLPALVLCLVAGFLLILVGLAIFPKLRREAEGVVALPPPALAAIAGAGMWVLFDFIRRARRLDLRPVDLLWASFRLVIAGPLGLALAGLLAEGVGVAVGFAIGAFPTRRLMSLLRRAAVAGLKLGGVGEESALDLQALQGVRRAEAERFDEEGVGTIVQLAYADPVDLTIRTSFSFSYVVDCCSQALAWLYFEDDLAKLGAFGLRGGQEIRSLTEHLKKEDSDEPEEKAGAEQAKTTLALAAKAIGKPPAALKRCLREVAEDPYVRFLYDVWQTAGLGDGEDEDS